MLVPTFTADTAAAAAAHLWHLAYQLGAHPAHLRTGPTAKWCELAAELTILSEQLRAGAAGRRVIPFDDGRRIHTAALRAAVLQVFAQYEGARRERELSQRELAL